MCVLGDEERRAANSVGSLLGESGRFLGVKQLIMLIHWFGWPVGGIAAEFRLLIQTCTHDTIEFKPLILV